MMCVHALKQVAGGVPAAKQAHVRRRAARVARTAYGRQGGRQGRGAGGGWRRAESRRRRRVWAQEEGGRGGQGVGVGALAPVTRAGGRRCGGQGQRSSSPACAFVSAPCTPPPVSRPPGRCPASGRAPPPMHRHCPRCPFITRDGVDLCLPGRRSALHGALRSHRWAACTCGRRVCGTDEPRRR